MPVKSCSIEGNPGFKWGDQGKCYAYTPGNEESRKTARSKAIKQGVAIGEFAELDDSERTPPASASSNAKKALDWKNEHGSEVKGGTDVGWSTARKLAESRPISDDLIKRMAQFNRHRKNSSLDSDLKGTPWKDAGYVAWLLWGGTSGVDWAIRKSKKISMEEDEMDFSETLEDVEIFKVGTWNGHKFVQEDLENIVQNSNELIETNKEKPPLKLGHSKKQILGQSDGQPALGWIGKLKVEGDKIVAKLTDVPQIVAKAIKKKLYNKVSIELAHSKHFGYYATALSLLGADLPAVKTLEDLSVYVASDSDIDEDSDQQFDLEPVIVMEDLNMNEELLKKLLARMEGMNMSMEKLKKIVGVEKEEDMTDSMFKKMNEKLDAIEKEKKMSDLEQRLAEANLKLEQVEQEKEKAEFKQIQSKIISKLQEDVEKGHLKPSIFKDLKEDMSYDNLNFSEGKIIFDHEFVLKMSQGYGDKLKTSEGAEQEEKVELSDNWQDTALKGINKIMEEEKMDFSDAQDKFYKLNPEFLKKHIG